MFHLIWAAALLMPLWLKPSPITYIGTMQDAAPMTTVWNRPKGESAPSDSAWAAHCDSLRAEKGTRGQEESNAAPDSSLGHQADGGELGEHLEVPPQSGE